MLAYRYGWVDHILHSRPQVTEETLTTHKNIQLRDMRSFDSLREEQHFAAGCTLFQYLERKGVGRVHVGKQAHFTYDSSINFKTGRFEAQAMSLSLFLYCFCDCLCRCRSFVLSSCRLSPFHLSNVTVSKPCRSCEIFILNRASTIGESYCSLHVRKSSILGLGIRNTAVGIRNPTYNWNPESKFY